VRIVEVLVRVTRWRFETPPRNAVSVWRDKAATLLFLRSDTGLTGVGEAWSEGISPTPVVAFLEQEVASVLRDADPFDRGLLLDRIARLALVSCKPGLVSAGLSATDIALWDLAGQALGQPIHRLIGTRRNAVPAHASGGL
jgi:L-alanine-DL-glutamate epimerase-like enolase superfamily enzyme